MRNFIDELQWRGMLHDATPGIKDHLDAAPRVGYIGFDPTAPSMTIGNFVQIQLLRLFQLSGHTPIVLMGGATGRIGDPSGKDKERDLKSYDELDSNLAHQLAQMRRFLDFEGPNAAVVVNNYDFYSNMNVLDFLRNVGKTLTVNYMMSKESVKKRIETGISFTEFSYQLLQGYDFQKLFQTQNCTLQMGGSDQWGNITTGTEFVRKNLGEKVYAVTTPLLTKSDGSKFGKSEKGNIWLDGKLTSPYAFYQFWLRADDADAVKFFKYFTLKTRAETEALIAEKQPRELMPLLAEELTIRVHGEESFTGARDVSKLLFRKVDRPTLLGLKESTLEMIGGEIPTKRIAAARFETGLPLAELLAEDTDILESKSAVRRALKNNAISINKEKQTDYDATVSRDELLHGRFLLVENGKKNKFLVEVVR